MQCPYCGAEMELGTLRSRGCNYFLPAGETAPKLYAKKSMQQKRAVMLPPSPLGLTAPVGDDAYWPQAFLCRNCRRIMLPYEDGQ